MKKKLWIVVFFSFSLFAVENNTAPKRDVLSPTYSISEDECKKVQGNWTTDFKTKTDVCKDRKTRNIITISKTEIKKLNTILSQKKLECETLDGTWKWSYNDKKPVCHKQGDIIQTSEKIVADFLMKKKKTVHETKENFSNKKTIPEKTTVSKDTNSDSDMGLILIVGSIIIGLVYSFFGSSSQNSSSSKKVPKSDKKEPKIIVSVKHRPGAKQADIRIKDGQKTFIKPRGCIEVVNWSSSSVALRVSETLVKVFDADLKEIDQYRV